MLEALKQFTPLVRIAEHRRAVRLRTTHPEGLVPPLPGRIIIEPTNACNLGCAYCGNKDMVRPHTFLPLDRYEQLLEEMVDLGIPRTTLHTVGEPTLHPHVAQMIRMAKERGRVVTMSTNATLLKEELARALVHAGPDMLHISADAADADVLAKTRDGLKLEVLLEGVRNLRRIRDAEGPVSETPWGRVRLPTLAITCVVTHLFTRDVERRFFETFAPLVDDIVFHTPNNHGGYVHDEPMHRRGLVPRSWRKAFYKRVRRPCPYPWDTLYLLSDLTVSVCRWDFDARIRIGRYGEQSVPELWNSPAMQSLRRAHMAFQFGDWSQCEDCTGNLYEANRYDNPGDRL